MRLSHFFIERPIFAAAVSVVITLVGVISYFTLPVDQYPNIAPPTVSVNAVYPGATAEEIAETVAAPLEQQINGITGMLYMSSSSTGEGRMTISVTFKTGINVDIAQVEVQNRIQSVLPQLPQGSARPGYHGAQGVDRNPADRAHVRLGPFRGSQVHRQLRERCRCASGCCERRAWGM